MVRHTQKSKILFKIDFVQMGHICLNSDVSRVFANVALHAAWNNICMCAQELT